VWGGARGWGFRGNDSRYTSVVGVDESLDEGEKSRIYVEKRGKQGQGERARKRALFWGDKIAHREDEGRDKEVVILNQKRIEGNKTKLLEGRIQEVLIKNGITKFHKSGG